MVSAVAGGIGLIGGGLAFPPEWLVGTPFTSYGVPGAILVMIVGGSALVAAALMLRHHPLAVLTALGAGVIQVGWIIGELLLVGTRDQVMAWLQVTYFAAGTVVASLAAHLWLQHSRPIAGCEGGSVIRAAGQPSMSTRQLECAGLNVP